MIRGTDALMANSGSVLNFIMGDVRDIPRVKKFISNPIVLHNNVAYFCTPKTRLIYLL